MLEKSNSENTFFNKKIWRVKILKDNFSSRSYPETDKKETKMSSVQPEFCPAEPNL